MRDKDPSLGEYKSNLTKNDGFVRSKWIEKQKGGNAKFPTKSLAEHVKIWEDLFENFHEGSTDGLLRCENVTKTLIDKISNLYPDYPRQLIHKFVFAKTMQRLRCIQNEDQKARQKTRESLRSKTKRLTLGH